MVGNFSNGKVLNFQTIRRSERKMLLNNKKTHATMKLVWEYVIVHMCSSLSEIDMLSNTQNLPANQTDYESYEKYCLNCEFSQ